MAPFAPNLRRPPLPQAHLLEPAMDKSSARTEALAAHAIWTMARRGGVPTPKNPWR